MSDLKAEEVEAAAGRIVECFEDGDRNGYFSCFTPDARFIFFDEQTVLEGRTAYERVYDARVQSGWRVVECNSYNHSVRILGEGAALFTHDVDVSVETAIGSGKAELRESIVFHRQSDGRLLAVHEHLSAKP